MKKSIVFVIFTMIFSAAGCNRISNLVSTSESNSNGSSTSGSNPVKASSNPRDDVLKASKKFMEQDAFQAKMDIDGKTNMHMEIEFIAPDRYHIKNSASMEIIIIGKDTYIKMNDAWKKSPANLGDSIPKMRDAFTEEGIKSMGDFENAVEDSVNGKSAFLYRYKGKTIKDPTSYNSKLWIGKDNGLPLKIEVEYPDNEAIKKMTTIYEYDTKITIEAPTAN